MKRFFAFLISLMLIASLCYAESPTETIITLEGTSAAFDNPYVQLKDNVLAISGEGTYVLTGSSDGLQITVSLPKGQTARLILRNADLCCDFGPALYVQSNGVTLVADDGTENRISDTDARNAGEVGLLNAVIAATDSLSLAGSGSMEIISHMGNGIYCKDYLTLEQCTLTVRSANDGLRANDGVEILSGSIAITASGDGIQTSNSKDGKGDIVFRGGSTVINAEKDTLQAAGFLRFEGGTVTTQSRQNQK